ncbi:MAG: RagB/SusD family nutrient uptake outer membrane protein [Gemmatimonadota bacterium]|nr:RagB/SusD family nutrient uptake outer membrane protein [Gemmatimonadota bacterium]
MTITSTRNDGGERMALRRALALMLAVTPLAGCDMDRLLESEAPTRLEAERLQSPTQAGLLLNGAIADFECAHGAFVAGSALMGDELEDAQLAAAVWDWDRRSFNANPGGAYGTNVCNAQLFGVYTPLATARWTADNLLNRLTTEWTDQQVAKRDSMIASAAVYAGFSLAEMGMILCSAAIDAGPEMSSTELFRAAEERFTRAIAAATAANTPTLRNAALAGRARVRLYLDNNAGAAEDARQVPAGFVFNATAADVSDSRRWNRIFHFVNFSRFHMVEEQSRNLTTGGVADPRTRSTQTADRALDGRPAVVQNKYASRASPLPITRYEEAQLILAEIEGGQTAINVINALRAPHGLPQVSAAEAANLQNTLLEERRRELWLEGQRMYDIRRFNLPQAPAPGTPFAKGGVYGSTLCLPLPDVERFNNPSIS